MKASSSIQAAYLHYHPFGGAVFADGSENPECYNTFNGWRTYIRSISSILESIFGTRKKTIF